jgi:uncharacterized alkaline shock family protein YloU
LDLGTVVGAAAAEVEGVAGAEDLLVEQELDEESVGCG